MSTQVSSEPGQSPADATRRHVQEMWSAVAGGWEQQADFVEQRGADVTAQLIAATAPQRGERVLELASGAGDVGLAAAPLVAPGEVVLSDLAAEMTAIATRRASARRVANVTARTYGLEAIDEQDASFDVVLCREGLMFAVEPALAVREIARVLRPGGRAALAVWGPRPLNPWLGVVFDALSAELGRPVPPPGVPGPFALADADGLRALLEGSGLEKVDVRELSVPLSAPSFEVWRARVTALAGPLAAILAGLPDAARRGVEQRLRAAVEPFALTDGALRFPGVARLASGRVAETGGAPR